MIIVAIETFAELTARIKRFYCQVLSVIIFDICLHFRLHIKQKLVIDR